MNPAGQAAPAMKPTPWLARQPILTQDEKVLGYELPVSRELGSSSRPLLLLACEIVSGGKQDRVIGKDRILPAESDPVDLSVFCVEPGGATSEHFGASEAIFSLIPCRYFPAAAF